VPKTRIEGGPRGRCRETPSIALAKPPGRNYIPANPDIRTIRGWRQKGPAQSGIFATNTGKDIRLADLARLTEIIEPEATALGFELVRVAIIGSEAGEGERALQIMAEDPVTGQLLIDQCAALSRRVSDRIDALEEEGVVLIRGSYHLEVSSPGIDRPLTRFKDFAAWLGHEAKVELGAAQDGQRRFRGNLSAADAATQTIAIEDRNGAVHEIAFGDVAHAKLVLTDALIAATRPVSTEGADEIETEETEEQED